MAKYFTKEGDDFKEVEQFTQEDIDEIEGNTTWLNTRLERERGKFADYDDLKTKASSVETIKSDYETKLGEVNTQVETLTKELGGAKLATEKVKIVNEFKLSDDLAEFVTGENADEMRKRAEKLAKGVTGGKLTIDKKPKPGEGKTGDSKVIAGKLFGSKSGDV